MHQAHTSPSEEAQMGPWRESILIKEKERNREGGTAERDTANTERKEKREGEGEEENGGFWPPSSWYCIGYYAIYMYYFPIY